MEVADYSKNLIVCPNQWLIYNQRCYFISEEKRTRDQSWQYCKSQGAALLTINDKKELDVITALLDKNSYYWIGLSCSMESTLIWDDKTPLQTNLFYKYCYTEYCFAFGLYSEYKHSCYQSERWICEKASTQIQI
ncbi:natural killer cells antigen CD94-like isoform X2 [Protopterus annectens]|uniref:natural killer cells antigen CD94-like isoform X2 n=1 Tax=Protopterus annectens TaxID=7888 RepID=UPI001CFBBB9A|nr:natural killer cells antigen CD94-like isoform X2 [Protopterus annectens]